MTNQEEIRVILNSASLHSLADHIDTFLALARDSDNRPFMELYYALLTQVVVDQGRKSGLGVVIYRYEESAPEYLYNYWAFGRTAQVNMRRLGEIAKTIRLAMQPAKAPGLSIQTINHLLNLAEQKFQYCSRVLTDHPLKILQLDNSHYSWNCYYSATFVGDVLIKDYVMMSCLREKSLHQEFGFVHELGHVLHTRLTKKLFTPPTSFSYFERMYDKKDKRNNRVMSEHFADVFAIAVLSNSAFAYCIPFEIDPRDEALFSLYILITIASLDERLPRSTNELLEVERILSETKQGA